MLYEIPHTRQTNQHHVKRWFTSCDMDLFVWFRNNTLHSFQLTYDKGNDEKAISWHDYPGFRHYLVDSGETFPGQYKQTPILIDLCDQQNLVTLARDFLASSKNIDTGISDFIYARLMAHQTTTAKRRAMNTGRFRAT